MKAQTSPIENAERRLKPRGRVRRDNPRPRPWMVLEVAPDHIVRVREPAPLPRARDEQQPWVLDPTGTEHDRAGHHVNFSARPRAQAYTLYAPAALIDLETDCG